MAIGRTYPIHKKAVKAYGYTKPPKKRASRGPRYAANGSVTHIAAINGRGAYSARARMSGLSKNKRRAAAKSSLSLAKKKAFARSMRAHKDKGGLRRNGQRSSSTKFARNSVRVKRTLPGYSTSRPSRSKISREFRKHGPFREIRYVNGKRRVSRPAPTLAALRKQSRRRVGPARRGTTKKSATATKESIMAKRKIRRKKGAARKPVARKRRKASKKSAVAPKRRVKRRKAKKSVAKAAPKKRRRRKAKKTTLKANRRRRLRRNYGTKRGAKRGWRTRKARYAPSSFRKRSKRRKSKVAAPKRRRGKRKLSQKPAARKARARRRAKAKGLKPNRRRARRVRKNARRATPNRRRRLRRNARRSATPNRRRRVRKNARRALSPNRRRRSSRRLRRNGRRRMFRKNGFMDPIVTVLKTGGIALLGFGSHKVLSNLFTTQILNRIFGSPATVVVTPAAATAVTPATSGLGALSLDPQYQRLIGSFVVAAGGVFAINKLVKDPGTKTTLITGAAVSFMHTLASALLTKFAPAYAGILAGPEDGTAARISAMYGMQGLGRGTSIQPRYAPINGMGEYFGSGVNGLGEYFDSGVSGLGEYFGSGVSGLGAYQAAAGYGANPDMMEAAAGYGSSSVPGNHVDPHGDLDRELNIAEAAAGVGGMGAVQSYEASAGFGSISSLPSSSTWIPGSSDPQLWAGTRSISNPQSATEMVPAGILQTDGGQGVFG